MDLEIYNKIRTGRAAFYEQPRGLIEIRGKEAVQFLDGMITNDMKTLEDGAQMLAAFPNAQGRLVAVIRVQRRGDSYFIETEDATREKLFQNLFRFTFAGDFFVEDLSEQFAYFEIFGPVEDVYHREVSQMVPGSFAFAATNGASYFVLAEKAEGFRDFLTKENHCLPVDEELYETLRVESGIPRYGVDMDESTIVPELGLEGMISYSKGCYLGQEIIARIHFRGHVAKQLTGLVLAEPLAVAGGLAAGTELLSVDGKNAGKVTSMTFSPKLGKNIALAFVRYDYLPTDTKLRAGDLESEVTELPFI
ncbi:MAG TPA: glycine cleavage T C-terminal barrel domain-containing protein [Pyrinomonadaceae bacterium]